MPSERFYRLTKEKKKVIMDAAKKEFAKVSFEKASINKMIQDANISRGSFYTYFEDKCDVVKYILEEYKQDVVENCIRFLNLNEGHVFQLFEHSFDQTVERFETEKETRDMFFHIFEYHKNRDGIPPFESEEGYEMLQTLYPYINQDQWKEKNIETAGLVLSMCGMIWIDAFMRYHHNPSRLEEIRLVYHKKIKVLQYGVLDQE